ncbi:rRNA maturation RNase YbeY [Candidatus Gottesmanbacteria bacterium]|nr:rRNA maturation RNase YbeY [Candidatus Gottesmanbacteria bacterium]MBI5452131.1 rRNA maturation RNase YbeY [Candidatus Gottesmanbacteria bacterium]
MITVLIKTESHYNVNRQRVREAIAGLLQQKGIKLNVEVSIVVVGDRLMKKLNNTYRHIDDTTDVLSFPQSDDKKEVPFMDPPDGILRLGDIVISYPAARDDAMEEGKLVDDKIDELVEHGMRHLLGEHHDE